VRSRRCASEDRCASRKHRAFVRFIGSWILALYELCDRKRISINASYSVVQESSRQDTGVWSKVSEGAHHVEGVGVGIKPRARFKRHTYHANMHSVPEFSNNYHSYHVCRFPPAFKSTETSTPEIHESLPMLAYMCTTRNMNSSLHAKDILTIFFPFFSFLKLQIPNEPPRTHIFFSELFILFPKFQIPNETPLRLRGIISPANMRARYESFVRKVGRA